MTVTLIGGRARSGKTTWCYEHIAKALEQDEHERLFMLVPEQFNLQTQKELAKTLYPGLLQAEVISFKNLALKVFKETGMPKDKPIIDDLERMMILKKLLTNHAKELHFFKKSVDKEGFVESMNRLITLCGQNQIEDKVLRDLTTDANLEEAFKSKLQDTQMILSVFEGYISERFMTAEGTLELLGQKIKDAKQLAETTFWIDGFYGFTAQQLHIIGELMVCAKKIYITLPLDQLYPIGTKLWESNPFYESAYTYQKLLRICQDRQISEVKSLYLEADREKCHEDLTYLEQNFLRSYTKPYTRQSEHIHLNTYGSISDEVESMAITVMKLVRDQGYRYKDIAILVGDLAPYQTALVSVLSEYQIPYFLDTKKSIHTHRLITFIEGTLELISQNWSYKSVFQTLRTGILGVDKQQIDQLENYVLAHGIKGRNKWQEVWQFAREGQEEVENEQVVNAVREQVVSIFGTLEQQLYGDKVSMSQKHTIKQMTIALYEFLEDAGIYAQLEQKAAYYEAEGERLLAMENSQIWKQVIHVLEKLVEVLGDEKETLGTYKKILKTSFSYLKMGIIPPAQDQIMIGTIDRSRIPSVEALFVLGMNEGVIPKQEESVALFTDMERLTLQSVCQEDDQQQRFYEMVSGDSTNNQLMLVYTALTRAKHQLMISSYLADDEGKPARPSQVFYKLKKLLKIEVNALLNSQDPLEMLQSPMPAFGYVGQKMREEVDGRGKEAIWKDALSWFKMQPEWQGKVENLVDYIFYTNQQHYLEPKTAQMLYELPLSTSVSKLETFRQCACCYFVKYGLKAQERQLFKWNAADLGTIFHSVLEYYPKELASCGTTWRDVSANEMDVCIGQAVRKAVSDYNTSRREDGKFRYTVQKVEKMAKRAVNALTTQIRAGAFDPKDYEVGFGMGDLPEIRIAIDTDRSMLLRGQIDRVDVYYKEGEQLIKILDYKSGKKAFDLLEVYYGLQLQLLLYLDAYIKLNQAATPAGMFYFHIDNPYTEYEPGMSEEELAENQIKKFKLSGLVLGEPEVINDLEEGGKGKIIPAALNTKDGQVRKGSSIASLEQFDQIATYVMDTIRELGKQILDGKVAAKPYQLQEKEPCSYCKYHNICQFDTEQRDNTYDKLEKLSKEAIWEAIDKGGIN
ncbi:MAG: helicase-exonuclease AddAB subunit AddB [Cellulosilyticaceae bacterium]